MRKMFTAALALSAALVMATPCYAGWNQTATNKWYFTDDRTGEVVKSQWAQDTTDKWFLIGSDGYVVVNRWIYDGNDTWYYAGSDGYLLQGKYKVPENKNYYSTPEGRYITDTIAGGSYKFDADGQYYE